MNARLASTGDVAHRRPPQAGLLQPLIEPFLKGETPKGMFGGS